MSVPRLKEYKDYPSKIQWQDKEQTKAHFDKTGGCKGQQETTEQSPTPRTKDDPQRQLNNLTNDEMLARIYDMMGEMYRDYIDKKTKGDSHP